MSLEKVNTVWSQNEINALVKKLSINYKRPKLELSYSMRELFYKKSQVDKFKERKLFPEILPKESTIIYGLPLAGKTLLMKAWKELLSNKIKKTTHLMDNYSRRYENEFNARYSKALANSSSKWILERDTYEFFDNYEKSSKQNYTEIVSKRYYFLDDLFFRNPYPYGSEKKTDQNFLTFQESLFRFLEMNENIIVIASTNNMPNEVLASDKSGTIKSRYEKIFKKENRIRIGEK